MYGVREQIAAQHKGNLAAHVAETNRIAEAFRDRLRLGRVVRTTPRGETSATSAVSLTRHGFLATLPVVAVW